MATSSAERHSRGRYIVVVVLLAALTLITVSSRSQGTGVLGSVRKGAHSVLSNIESGLHTALRPVGNFLAGAADYGSLKSRYDQVLRENESLNASRAQYVYDQTQEQMLLKLSGIPFAGSISTVPAQVIQQPSSNFETTLTIDKGADSGITAGEPVVVNGGLVGHVIATTSSSSTVELISDTASVVGVALPSAQVGTAKGQGYTDQLNVSPIPTGSSSSANQPKVGSVLFTSALGGVYPAGIPVARVTRVSGSGVDALYTARPMASLTNLSYVAVMRWSGQGAGK